MKERIYVTGSRGLVGSRFVELLSEDYELITPEIDRLDITKPRSLQNYFKRLSLDAIVNFAAFTDVSGGELERGNKNGPAWKVNVSALENLINLAKIKNARFIQISTDMVFPGSEEDKGPYSEERVVGGEESKLTWYGYTKALGEKLTRDKIGKDTTILRLIYPVRSRFEGKLDYLRKPLSLYDQGKLYPMFNDQFISITFVDEIAEALKIIIDRGLVGVFHAGSSDITTPYDVVSYLLERARGVKNAVKPSSLDEFLKTVDNPVRYPKYGGLEVSETEKALGIKFSSSRKIIDKLILQGLGK